LKVGITAGLALLLLAVIIFTVERFHFGRSGYPLDVSFDFVDAIKPQADVVIGGGVKIGQVDTITVQGERVHLRVIIDRDIHIPEDAKFQILSKGLMGDKYLNVVPQTTSRVFLKPGAQVRGVEPTNIDKAFQRFGQVADSVRMLLGDPELKNSFVDMLKNFSSLSSTLDRIVKKNENRVNRSIQDFSAASQEISVFSRDLSRMSGSLGKLLNDENAANIQSTLKSLKTTSARLEQAADKISKGEGALGALIEDKELAQNLKTLVKDVKDNPWKLLWKQ